MQQLCGGPLKVTDPAKLCAQEACLVNQQQALFRKTPANHGSSYQGLDKGKAERKGSGCPEDATPSKPVRLGCEAGPPGIRPLPFQSPRIPHLGSLLLLGSQRGVAAPAPAPVSLKLGERHGVVSSGQDSARSTHLAESRDGLIYKMGHRASLLLSL